MDAFDARQLDVGSCRRAGNEGHRAEHASDRRRDQSHRLWDRSDDLPLLDDAEVVVGNERSARPPCRARRRGRSFLSRRSRGRSQSARRRRRQAQARRARRDELGLVRAPLVGRSAGTAMRRSRASRSCSATRLGDVRARKHAVQSSCTRRCARRNARPHRRRALAGTRAEQRRPRDAHPSGRHSDPPRCATGSTSRAVIDSSTRREMSCSASRAGRAWMSIPTAPRGDVRSCRH